MWNSLSDSSGQVNKPTLVNKEIVVTQVYILCFIQINQPRVCKPDTTIRTIPIKYTNRETAPSENKPRDGPSAQFWTIIDCAWCKKSSGEPNVTQSWQLWQCAVGRQSGQGFGGGGSPSFWLNNLQWGVELEIVCGSIVASVTQAPWGGSTFKPLNCAWEINGL